MKAIKQVMGTKIHTKYNLSYEILDFFHIRKMKRASSPPLFDVVDGGSGQHRRQKNKTKLKYWLKITLSSHFNGGPVMVVSFALLS